MEGRLKYSRFFLFFCLIFGLNSHFCSIAAMKKKPKTDTTKQVAKLLDLPDDMLELIILFGLAGENEDATENLLSFCLVHRNFNQIVKMRILENYFSGMRRVYREVEISKGMEYLKSFRVPREAFYIVINQIDNIHGGAGSLFESVRFLIPAYVLAGEESREKKRLRERIMGLLDKKTISFGALEKVKDDMIHALETILIYGVWEFRKGVMATLVLINRKQEEKRREKAKEQQQVAGPFDFETLLARFEALKRGEDQEERVAPPRDQNQQQATETLNFDTLQTRFEAIKRSE